MDRVSRSGARELTEPQQRILQAAIDKAVCSGIPFNDVDDITEYLRANGVPEQLLADEYLKVRTNLWMRRICPTTAATGQILTGPAATENPRLPSPPRLGEGQAKEEGLSCDVDSVAAFGDELLRWPTFFVSVSPDDGASWDGLSCRIYKPKGNFIRAEAAAQLQLPMVIGTRQKLAWKLDIEGYDKTRQSLFTIVENNVLDVDVALGIEWLDQDKEQQTEAGDVIAIDPDEERIGASRRLGMVTELALTQTADAEIQSCSSRETRHIIQHIPSGRTIADIPKITQLLETLVKRQEKLFDRYDDHPVLPEILMKTHADLINILRKATDAVASRMRNDHSAPQQVPALPSSQ